MRTTVRLVSVGLLASLCGFAIAQEGVQWTPAPSTKSRAEVRAELQAAKRTGSLSRGEASYNVQPQADRALSRTQVRAEAAEASRLGLTATNEGGARQPTAAELQQIRQAGQRAVDSSTQHAGR